jgi:pseudouridine-5'-phosphate glycosidase
VTFLVAEEVALAVAGGGAVVALETSVIGQGLPHHRNLECVERMSGAIRDAGAAPPGSASSTVESVPTSPPICSSWRGPPCCS